MVVAFLRKHIRILIIGFILITASIGMIICKETIEKNRLSPSSTNNNEFYFKIFQALAILTIAYVILSWFFKKIREYRQLKNERMEAELAMLKSKIDPHFFFNTLNNLYSLAIKKSDDTAVMIQKLSEIMRYTIYEGDNKFVRLSQEIAYLDQYIEIHKIRYKKNVAISFNKEVKNPNLSIAPLLFIMLLENAFKHGVESLTDNAYVKINLVTTNDQISFTIKNNYKSKKDSKSGMGLENLKRRLSLMYPRRHELILSSKGDIYSANLTIQIE